MFHYGTFVQDYCGTPDVLLPERSRGKLRDSRPDSRRRECVGNTGHIARIWYIGCASRARCVGRAALTWLAGCAGCAERALLARLISEGT